MQFFDTAFHVAGMDWDQWMWCLFLGFTELLWGQVIFTIPKNVVPGGLRCVAVGVPQGRGIAYIRSCSRVEQTVHSSITCVAGVNVGFAVQSWCGSKT